MNGMWLNVGMRISTMKTCVLQEIGWHALNTLTILDTIVNMIGGGLCDHLMNTEISHFDSA